MHFLPKVIDRGCNNYYIGWLIFHIWLVDICGLMVDFDISTLRFGFGIQLIYLRIWIGWMVLPYKVSNALEFLNRNTDVHEEELMEDYEVIEEDDD